MERHSDDIVEPPPRPPTLGILEYMEVRGGGE